MGFYDKMSVTSNRLIKQYGMKVMLRRISVGSAGYVPAAGGVEPIGSDGSTDSPRYILKLDQPGSQIAQRFGVNRQVGSLVERNEKWGYLDADGPAPQLQDKIIMEGIEYSILDVQAVGPSGVNVIYQLVMRA